MPRVVLRFLLLTLVLASAGQAVAAVPATELQQLRAVRRAVLHARSVTARKAGTTVPFGLLVIPVDFTDARLPGDWDQKTLAKRLTPDAGETLYNYFRIASGGRLDLKITLAPAVHLAETRRQYSDRDLNGFSRTRKLATEAITATRDLGLEFRRLDDDGPDGVAGTADDDGQVDGVLILHAGAGTENDPQDGLVQAVQFFLAEPVYSQGIAAAFYAVASLQSGPGIWAHETAHLLGLEDRYDPLLPVSGASEVVSRGGLGRFSLMSSGAWGTGGGYGAALPDAYSAQQVGWLPVRNITRAGSQSVRPNEALRVWTAGRAGPEYFLLATRDPVASAPFDADVPGGNLLVYHIDENLPEGAWHSDTPTRWHLRARLVEADDDRGLESGGDQGSLADLFPGSLDANEFGPLSTPGSRGYYDGPSNIALSGVQAVPGAVNLNISLDSQSSVSFSYAFGRQGTALPLSLQVQETGPPLPALSCRLTATSTTEDGSFQESGSRTITVPLQEQEPGLWAPTQSVTWLLDSAPSGADQTQFEILLFQGSVTYAQETRVWVWSGTGTELDFKSNWPGAWVIAHPDGNLDTTWHRWSAAPWLTADHTAVLACTGAMQTTASAWPAVTYGNRAHTTLTSAPLAADVGAVRLTHAIEVEMLTGTTAMDGGLVVWVAPDGRELPATPLGGYGGQISEKSVNPRHGEPAFVAPELALTGNELLWRTDTFSLPQTEPGPWRLRLVFASNTLWRARGWFIADIEAIASAEQAVDFAPAWAGDLTWRWPWPTVGPVPFTVEIRTDPTIPWATVLTENIAAGGDGVFHLDGASITQGLAASSRQRRVLRLLGDRPAGQVASRAIVLYPDGGDGRNEVLGQPWPNPALGAVRFLLDIPGGSQAQLKVFDTRGRLVSSVVLAAGRQLASWDGRTTTGARAAAGIYFLRLEGTGPVLTRKVVLLH